MSVPANVNERPALIRKLASLWRDWTSGRPAASELQWCGPAETKHMARDVGLSSADLCVLAGKWPGAAAPLTERLKQLELDAADITQAKPQVMRDLQRVCSLCASKRTCEHDLARRPSNARWQDYCPNATTLTALLPDRAGKAAAP
jgi:hypothetical protein